MTTTLPLSRDRILRCAVELADRDGLEATSLRKVAGELGVHVTSLYHHVATKDALLDGIVEELFATAPLPHGSDPWDLWVRRFIDAIGQIARTHPGAFAVLLRRAVQGPRAAATFEAGLAAFQRAGMDVPAAYTAVKSVALASIGACMEQTVTGDNGPSTDMSQLPLEDFPVLHQASQTVDGIVDVAGALADLLVAGFTAQLAG